MTKRIFIVTGEPSGDLHASFVVKELKKLIPDIVISAIGGNALKKQGVNLIHDHSNMAVVGLDSFKKIPEHLMLGLNIIKYLKTDFDPDLVLLIDYGGFNLRLAEHLKKNGYKVFYYISPQVWASRKGRLKKIAKFIDKMMVIFPFEEEIHKKANVNAEFVGHPLVSQLPIKLSKTQLCSKYNLDNSRPVVGIFPGSRKMEINFLLDIFIQTAAIMKTQMPQIQFCLAQSDNIKDDLIRKYINKSDPNNIIDLKIFKNANYDFLSASDMVILASGTVTLEAAIYQTPMIISYKSYWIAYYLYLMLRYIDKLGLPNIIMGKSVVPEFLQADAIPENMAKESLELLLDTPARNKMLNDLADVNKTLTNKVASVRVAEILFNELSQDLNSK